MCVCVCVCVCFCVCAYVHERVCVCVYTRVVQKVLSLTQKEEPWLNIFVVATHYHLL